MKEKMFYDITKSFETKIVVPVLGAFYQQYKFTYRKLAARYGFFPTNNDLL
jgi:hypothetical protein